MDTWNWIFLALNVGCALIFVLISIPLLKDKIPMNYFYGMRVPKAFTSDENWYLVNRYGARQMILWSIPLLLVGLAALFVRVEDDDLRVIVPFILAPVIPPLLSLFATLRYARTLP